MCSKIQNECKRVLRKPKCLLNWMMQSASSSKNSWCHHSVTSGLYQRKSVSIRFVFDEVKVPRFKRKQTSNRKIALRKCLEKCQKAKDGSAPLERKRHKKMSAMRSVHMRQTDRSTAETVLNIVREVKHPSRMLQRVSFVTSDQKDN